MWVCTATTRHGDWHETVVGGSFGTPESAFADAVHRVNIGYRPSYENAVSGETALMRWGRGERPAPGQRYMEVGHVHLKDEPEGPVVSIGWTDYVLREVPQVPRLWQVTAQVSTKLGDWSGSRQVPTFFIDPAVQGALTHDAALSVADDIVHTMAGPEPGVIVGLTITPVY